MVRDAYKQQLAYVYYENEPGRRLAAKLLTKDEARRIARSGPLTIRSADQLTRRFRRRPTRHRAKQSV